MELTGTAIAVALMGATLVACDSSDDDDCYEALRNDSGFVLISHVERPAPGGRGKSGNSRSGKRSPLNGHTKPKHKSHHDDYDCD